ncbi:response regulator [Methylobacterium sp. NEAU 140]|uniref:response regulator n=1 Tax=Methylobacterium sp. NEAU 140 TaxID=3064945 RepID=UPI002735803D|nr:response regulator [Methylobacterium sp. NEAU 140]MDP4022407.1 response regulator [Methylobacterium sp. NEAU 140]
MTARGWIGLRGLVVAGFVLVGGGSVLVGARFGGAAGGRSEQGAVQQVATAAAERFGAAFAEIGRDLHLAAENALLAGDATAQTQRFLERWRALHPEYGDVLLADASGRVLATASSGISGADVSGTTWFTRGRSGLVIGDASDRGRGDSGSRNLIVAAPVRAAGGAGTGVLAVQLTSDWIDGVIAAARRDLGGFAGETAIRVVNGGGRTLHRSGVAAARRDAVEATVPVSDGAGLGWLVSAERGPARIDGAALPWALLATVIAAAALAGWLVGTWLTRGLDRIRRAAAGDGLATGSAVTDLAHLAEAVRACVDRGQARERLLVEARAALARSRDRVRAVRLLGGFTCWEVDLRNGQVTWADGSAAAAKSASERACDLNEVLARVADDDRAPLRQAMRDACAEPGSIREILVRTLPGPDEAGERRLMLRLTAVARDTQPIRLHVLSREVGLAMLPPSLSAAPHAEPLAEPPAEPLAEIPARSPAEGSAFPAREIVAGLARDLADAIAAIRAALKIVARDAADGREAERAERAAVRGAALVRRMLVLAQGDADRPETEAVLADTVDLIRATLLPDAILAVSQDRDLPPLPCSARRFEAVLLNLACDARASLPRDAALSLTVDVPRDVPRTGQDGPAGLRVALAAPAGFEPGAGLAAVRFLMEALGGSLRVAAADDGTTVTLLFPPAPAESGARDGSKDDDRDGARDGARDDDRGAAAERAVLLVEPDAVLRAAAADCLTRDGYVVTAVASSEAAQAALAARRDFAVLLCAHAPPDLNGVMLAKVVERTHPAVAVVLTVADGDRTEWPAGSRVLVKPFGARDLARALDEARSRPLRAA